MVNAKDCKGDKRKMTVLEKIKRCVSLVWDFQEFYGEEDIEDFCDNELSTYTQYNEIVEYFKHLADLEKQIAELEAEVKEWKDKADLWCKTANLKDHNIMINKELEKENAELKEELKKWKDEWQDQVQKATDEGYARTLQTIQLTKAKKIIEKVAKMYRYSPRVDEIIEQAEQFLSEVEK